MIRRVFVSPAENRLRAGWRLLLQFIAMLGLANVLGLTVLFAHLYGAPFEIEFLLNEITLFIAATITILACRRFLDKRSVASLGLELTQAVPDLLAGFWIAAVIMGAIFLVEWQLGWLKFENWAWQTQSWMAVVRGLLVWFVLFAAGAWIEELLARGYWLHNLRDGLNLPAGVLISAIGFGLLHLLNPNVSWQALVLLMAAGLFFAIAYLLTKQLWLPIGLHLGWNYFEGNIFGFQVSGLDTFRLIQQSVAGPDWITGGAFGPEAGLIVLPALLLGLGFMYGYVRFLRPREPKPISDSSTT
jgi:hypothetical protein